MAANAKIADIPEDEHPALLLMRAHEIEREADELLAQSKAKRAESAMMRAKAERLRDGEHLAPKRNTRDVDPLLSAAGLAVEELVTFTSQKLGMKLQLRDRSRLAKLISALERMNHVVCLGRHQGEYHYRAIDPEDARVRDAIRELGTCSRAELAERLEVTEARVGPYVEEWERRGFISVAHDGHLMYLKPDPERAITRYPTRRPPENEPPAGLEAPRRGEPVRAVNHGKRGAQMSGPGRHRVKLRDQRRERMEEAKRERAEQQSQRDRARNAAGGKRRKK